MHLAVIACATLAWSPEGMTASPQTQRRVRFNRGIVAFYQHDYEGARRIFDALVGEQSDDVAALYWLGLCELQLDQYGPARSAFERVLQLDPQRLEAKLDAAIAMVGEDHYDASKTLLAEFLESGAGSETDRALANFFLGVSEYKTRNYGAALDAFENADTGTTAPEMQANIAWYRGWIYLEQRRFDEAAAEITRVTELSTNVDQIARARRMAEQVQLGAVADIVPSAFQLRVDMGFHYDSNVVLLGDDTSLEVGLSTDDDFRFGLSTDARYHLPLGEDWLVGLSGQTFHSWHPSLGEFNVQTYGGGTFVNFFAGERTTLGLQYEFDYTLVDNQTFLDRHRITPSVRFVEAFHEDGTSQTSTTVFYSYEPRDYHEGLDDRRLNRDGNYHAVGLTQRFNLMQPRLALDDPRWLSAAVGYRFRNESTQGGDFDLTGHGLNAALAVPLPAALMLEFSGNWRWEDYWQPNSLDARRRNREDFVQHYMLSLSREMILDRNVTLAIRGEISWTEDDSNVRNRLGEAIYSYDRLIAGVTLSFFFN